MTDPAPSLGGRATTAGTPRIINLRERARTFGVELSTAEVRLLRASNAGLRVIATGIDGRFDVEASQWVGTIVGPSTRFFIAPKISIRRVLFLMGFLPGAVRFTQRTTLDFDNDLLAVTQYLYADALGRALYGGLVRDYLPHRDDLSAPRGRIDALNVATRRFGVVPPVACTFDEFTADTEANRRLLAATRALLRAWPIGSAATRLRALAAQFQDVTLLKYEPRALTPLHLNRRTERYAAAIGLADLVLRNASIELRDGHTDAVGFLVDMDQTFERFVVDALRDALSLDARTWVHHPSGLALDDAGSVAIEPDAVWFGTDGSPLLVVDAKYKVSEQGLNADLYQMLAYTSALGLRCGVLVYANVEEHLHRVRHAGVEILTVALDPDGEPDEVLLRVRTLAKRLRAIAAGPSP